jgi:alpha-methylacyl-CoA racemase
MKRSPLQGIRVLDLSRLLPGPFCTLILAELGAEVIKVEDTGGGDYLRLIPPLNHELGGAFYALNRGKRSLSLDLKRPAGREALLRLLPNFQIVVESFRPGVLDRLGLGYAALSSVNPDVILCSITGYGQSGPLRDRAGHDIDYLALSGVLAAGGQVGDRPCLPGVQLADVAGGALWAAIRILAALYSGEGGHLDVSMTEGAMAFLLPWLGEALFRGHPLRRGEETLNGGSALYNVYKTADEKFLAMGALEPKFWTALSRELGMSCDMGDGAAPRERQEALREELQRGLSLATRDEWVGRLAEIDACVEPVLEMEELATHPQHRARGMFFSLEDPERGPLSLLRLPLDGKPIAAPAPRQGEHTDQVLAEAGFSEEEIRELRAEGVVR